ncbi:hypothetical protein COO60DRAFT_1267608 [Scenedesmus sp. NREL 46B-D3]|nr:hypothetical protein COO60DRAFT_1267608 [Scenedesmus sp. NREL 46B-D3]
MPAAAAHSRTAPAAPPCLPPCTPHVKRHLQPHHQGQPQYWTNCPYAHAGEHACRRDPRKFDYAAVVCPDLLQGGRCPRGESCHSAHSVFEFWLHPQRYRTQICREGPGCRRRVCFFAHSEDELRVSCFGLTLHVSGRAAGELLWFDFACIWMDTTCRSVKVCARLFSVTLCRRAHLGWLVPSKMVTGPT